ncbi:Checkpoint protein hus1 [Sporothrix eucalyptigena]|uniref:Checkpoint protein hus1 n=1 Tax=Sporothrix eucalyptigena TaxID=1812306 RepID=A0ABP0BIA8_9PEZI
MPKHKVKHTRVIGCCERGDHAITCRKPTVLSRPPTEPCPVCHNVVGLMTPEDVIETWAILPCSSRMSPKKAVRVAAQRVRTFSEAVGLSRAGEPEAESPGAIVAGSPGDGPAQEAGAANPIVIAPPALRAQQAAAPPSPKGMGRRRHRRRRLRQRASQSPRPAAAAGAAADPVASLPAITRVSSQTKILEILASRSHAQPANTPLFFQMAYPKDVDLTLPCTYCYLTLYREPEDSPYRGGNGNNGRNGSIFKGSSQDIARSAATIKRAASIAIRFFFKALPPNANDSANNNANNNAAHDSGNNAANSVANNTGDGANINANNNAGVNANANANGICIEEQRQMTNSESMLMAAYWDSWRQVNGKAFGEWWAEQEPRTEPAVEAVAEGWDLANMGGY